MKFFFKKIIVKILEWESRLILKKYQPKIVAITGTVGKTSTKDAIFSVLKEFYHVRKSDKSFNSEIGVPLTIIGCPNGWLSPSQWIKNIFKGLFLILKTQDYPKWLVLEVGAGKPGDIEHISSWLHPDVVVITRFSETPVHVEFFKSPQHIIEEKSNLIHALKPDGILVLNFDDEQVMELRQKAKNRIISYGFNDGALLRASHEQIVYDTQGEFKTPQGISFKLNCEGSSLPVKMNGVFSKTFVYAALAGLAIVYDRDLNMLKAISGIDSYEVSPGRLSLISGIKNSLIIDDSYNASPIACEAGLHTLRDIGDGRRKIAVLGDMLELGRYSNEAHKKVGECAASSSDILITVGLRARVIAEGALLAGMNEQVIYQFETTHDAGNFLQELLQPGDIALVKGSQSMRMERIVEEVMAHPEDKEKLLVRQEEEWKNKK